MRIILAVSIFWCAVAFGQSSSVSKSGPGTAQKVIRISVNLVQLDAVVTNKKGQQVTDLAAGDFELLQDGKPQAITNLSYVRLADPTEPALPLHPVKNPLDTAPEPPVKLAPKQVRRTIALIVDDLNLSFVNIARVRQALATFVDQQMQPGDLAAIVRTSAGIGALQEFTTDKRLLHAAIDRIRWTFVRDDDGIGGLDPSQGAVFAIGTLGAVRYVVNGLGQLPGRKSVVLFTDLIAGFSGPRVNPQLLESMHRLIDTANRAAAVIYAIDPTGLETFQITAQEGVHRLGQPMIDKAARRAQAKFLAQAGLDYVVEQTGGLFIYNDNDLRGAIHDVLEDQAGYYLIGYQPAAGTFDPVTGRRLFHSVKLRVKRPGLTVRSRSGFFGVADSDPDPSSTKIASREEQLARAIRLPIRFVRNWSSPYDFVCPHSCAGDRKSSPEGRKAAPDGPGKRPPQFHSLYRQQGPDFHRHQ